MQFTQVLSPSKVARWLGIVAVLFAIQSLINEFLLENVLNSQHSELFISFLDLFSVNAEKTIPTWYATVLLFGSAVILGVITAVKYQTRDLQTKYWAGLSIIFLYLSIDEGAVIHELFSTPLEETFNTSGYLTFGWLILFIPLLLIFALLYLRFLFHLPPRIRNLFILAGLFYVGGAVVVEAISANRYGLDGGVSFTYLAIATVEELLEMLGVVLFIYGLLSYMVLEGITAVISPTLFDTQTIVVMQSPARGSKRAKRIGLVIVALLFVLNSVIITWAFWQPAVSESNFPQLVLDNFEGQGIVILEFSELITEDNPAASPIAESLLTLFDDVIVVTFPRTQSSIAFASSQLPLTTDALAQLAQQSGETDFTILDTSALRAIAISAKTP